MALSLAPATSNVLTRRKIQFGALNGVPPYTYQVMPGGAGGTINGSGLYTAPASGGIDTVKVTDAALVVAQSTVNVVTPIQLVCKIIRTEMDLDNDQVYLWDQKINIPEDSKLYVAVGVLSVTPFSSNTGTADSAGLFEVQTSNWLATLSIDILSRGPEARDRKEEIILALGSFYAQSLQEQNSFYIARISTGFVNLSQDDGAAIPYRFNISVNIQYSVTKTKETPYYDTFEDPEVTTEA